MGSKNYTLDREVIAKDAKITEAYFPDISMTNLPYQQGSFDVVISDQVLEHIEGDVQKAVDESRRILKTGGIAIHTSVCIQPIHWGPKDLWRFTPDGLLYLCRDFSQILTCESWGNRWAEALFFLYENARDWHIPEHTFSIRHWLATKNDRKYPLMVWVVAKK